jgi:hypothetical protein
MLWTSLFWETKQCNLEFILNSWLTQRYFTNKDVGYIPKNSVFPAKGHAITNWYLHKQTNIYHLKKPFRLNYINLLEYCKRSETRIEARSEANIINCQRMSITHHRDINSHIKHKKLIKISKKLGLFVLDLHERPIICQLFSLLQTSISCC